MERYRVLQSDSRVISFDGVDLVAPYGIELPVTWKTAADVPDCCGVGSGWRNKAVPESIARVRISPACWLHDESHQAAPPTWEAFHSNSQIFRRNISAILEAKSHNPATRWYREFVTTVYFAGVDSPVGAWYFWDLKREQGYDVWETLRRLSPATVRE